MLRFHRPRVSKRALEMLPRILREQSGATDRVKGQIFGLPVYQALPAPTLSRVAQNAKRVGWRYYFYSEDRSSGSDAAIEFGRTEARKPFLKSFSRSAQSEILVNILAAFEKEYGDEDIAFYLQILAVPALNFELLWFNDARKIGARDNFFPLSPKRFGGNSEDELAGRFASLPSDP